MPKFICTTVLQSMTNKTYQPTLILHEDDYLQWHPEYSGPWAGDYYSEKDFNSLLAERDALKAELASVTAERDELLAALRQCRQWVCQDAAAVETQPAQLALIDHSLSKAGAQ